jgi:osmotically-inducible protein OsmY
MAKLRTLLFVGMTGAALMYFFDPDRGEGRRAQARDRFGSMMKRGRSAVDKQVRYREGQVEGLKHEVSSRGRSEPAVDDIEIKDRVESEVFGRRGFPKGKINAEVVDGRLILNGELDSEAEIEEVVAEVRAVPGVTEVENNLHVKGTMAPNKAAARKAG